MSYFNLNRGTTIVYEKSNIVINNGIRILKRDIDKLCSEKSEYNEIQLISDYKYNDEEYEIIVEKEKIKIYSSTDLGFVYGLLRISSEFLNVKPFWFWMNQKFQIQNNIKVTIGQYNSPKYKVRYRGWFFNDEVLMLGWDLNKQDKEGWRMGFEALLRCGGNTIIPGTDKMALENRSLAREYGLWITHHHAEPLGAEMFVRQYPHLEADYFKHSDKFIKLWEDAVIAQKDCNVIWNICFRGQGDCPFWENAEPGKYDTDEKRGKAISEIIQIQADIVKKYVDEPIFCTNLYGEILELYEEGYITFPENIIFVKADNGYGKMVTRRRGNHNPRVNAMPSILEKRKQGIYYHVSFYDLQAANHITMLPNSVKFVNDELNSVIENKGNELWIINCSNVKPHVYYLDSVRKKWLGVEIDDEKQAKEFSEDYFNDNNGICEAYKQYTKLMIPYGKEIDEHAGEQFYTENIRYFTHYALLNEKGCIKELQWLTGNMDYKGQLDYFAELCEKYLTEKKQYLDTYEKYRSEDIYLHMYTHYYGALGVVTFHKAYEALQNEDYIKAFVLFGDSAECFNKVDNELRNSETGIWKSFYSNECLADFSFTAYQIRKMMSYVRERGDNSEYYKWHHRFRFEEKDQKIHMVLFTEKHSTDEDIYKAIKMQGLF